MVDLVAILPWWLDVLVGNFLPGADLQCLRSLRKSVTTLKRYFCSLYFFMNFACLYM